MHAVMQRTNLGAAMHKVCMRNLNSWQRAVPLERAHAKHACGHGGVARQALTRACQTHRHAVECWWLAHALAYVRSHHRAESKLLILDHVTVESWQLTSRAGAQARTLHSPSLAAALKRVMSALCCAGTQHCTCTWGRCQGSRDAM